MRGTPLLGSGVALSSCRELTRISADIDRTMAGETFLQIDRWVYALAADDRSTEAYERAHEIGTQRLVEHLGGKHQSRHLCLQYQCV